MSGAVTWTNVVSGFLLGSFVVLVPVLFVVAVSVPLFLVETVSRSRLSPAYRYLFG